MTSNNKNVQSISTLGNIADPTDIGCNITLQILLKFLDEKIISLHLFQPVICKFNATRLDIDYDVPCDLPEYFECVEGKPPRPRPPFGRRPGGSHEGPGVGGPGFDGSAIFGERPVFDGDHSSTTRYFPEEGPRCHAEMGFCRQVNLHPNKAVRSRHSGANKKQNKTKQNPAGIAKVSFAVENLFEWIQISLVFVCQGSLCNKSAFVGMMVWGPSQ